MTDTLCGYLVSTIFNKSNFNELNFRKINFQKLTSSKTSDLSEPEIVPNNAKYFKGNLNQPDQLSEAMIDCEMVFHTASAGMSGAGQLNKSICEAVNVEGTQ